MLCNTSLYIHKIYLQISKIVRNFHFPSDQNYCEDLVDEVEKSRRLVSPLTSADPTMRRLRFLSMIKTKCTTIRLVRNVVIFFSLNHFNLFFFFLSFCFSVLFVLRLLFTLLNKRFSFEDYLNSQEKRLP